MTNQNQKTRTYARNRAFSRRRNERIFEPDSIFILKLVAVVILGTLWLKFQQPVMIGYVVLNALPIGAIIGIFLIYKLEKLQYNRKIWYVLLIFMVIVSYFLPAGIVV
jgi:hypothetical protein